MNKGVHTEHLHILFLCYVISKKFPRLLAEREIIANALLGSGFLPRTDCKSTNFPKPLQQIMGKSVGIGMETLSKEFGYS